MSKSTLQPNLRRSFRRRLVVFMSLLGMPLLLVLVTVANVQVLDPEFEDDRESLLKDWQVPLTPTRGFVYDREGDLLVSSRPAYRVGIIPTRFLSDPDGPDKLDELLINLRLTLTEREIRDEAELEALLQPLRREVGESIEEQLERIRALKESRNAASVEIDRYATPSEYAWLQESNARNRYPWMRVTANPARHYPLGEKLSHMTGYISKLDEKDVAELVPSRADYQGCHKYEANADMGKRGVERLFDRELRGCYGQQTLKIDRLGRVRREVLDRRIEPQAGQNVHLTLDRDLQAFAWDAFTGMTGGHKDGAIIVSKASTGEILAMVSQPGFDPNRINLDFKALEKDPRSPLYNRALQSKAHPSSVFKTIITAVALEESLIEEESEHTCAGVFRLGRDRFRCMKREGHGEIDLLTAIQKSCNVYFYDLGHRLSWPVITEYFPLFGLTQNHPLDIGGSEPAPIMTAERLKAEHEVIWQPGDTVVASIGQGYMELTPLQVHGVMSLIANDGMLMAPYAISHISDARGALVRTISQPTPHPANGDGRLQPSTVATLQEGLTRVTQPGGTAYWYAGRGVEAVVAGKTGTGQNSHGEDHAWFSGYAPADAPANERIVVTVLVLNAGQGGRWAAPIAASVLKYLFERDSFGRPQSMSFERDDEGAWKANHPIFEQLYLDYQLTPAQIREAERQERLRRTDELVMQLFGTNEVYGPPWLDLGPPPAEDPEDEESQEPLETLVSDEPERVTQPSRPEPARSLQQLRDLEREIQVREEQARAAVQEPAPQPEGNDDAPVAAPQPPSPPEILDEQTGVVDPDPQVPPAEPAVDDPAPVPPSIPPEPAPPVIVDPDPSDDPVVEPPVDMPPPAAKPPPSADPPQKPPLEAGEDSTE